MILTYPTLLNKPFIFVEVESGGSRSIHGMILDTGADVTCFPGEDAAFLGHNNASPLVQTSFCDGIGGRSISYRHTLRISLLNPATKVGSGPLKPIWTSSITQFDFVKDFRGADGLIGRDIMREWKRVTFIPGHAEWSIEIEI